MRGLGGLAALQMAGVPRPPSSGAFPIGGVRKGLSLSWSPANLNNSTESSSVATPFLTIAPLSKKRGALHAVSWRQLAGVPGQIIQDGPLKSAFLHPLPNVGSFPISWRGTVYNQYSEVSEFDVSFSLIRNDPTPALQATAYPTMPSNVPINPSTRQATINFSVAVTSGVPPYSVDWNGGDNPLSPSNSATFTLPVGATEPINFVASCWVTDGLERSILVQTANFFIFEGP